MKSLILNDLYSRKDIHGIFSPETNFTPQGGPWGLQGIIRIPDRENDFVFIVTLELSQRDHLRPESIIDGVLKWQSQARHKLDSAVIKTFINHDEIKNNIYLFLREKKGKKENYEYLGKLKYLSHNNEKENPVYFQWQTMDWVSSNQPEETSNTIHENESFGMLEQTDEKPTKKIKGTPAEGFKIRKSPDYAMRDAKNKALGDLGEALVLKYEKNRLEKSERKDLAEKVTHTSQVEGDGAGYDIKSYDVDGAVKHSVKYIEVKTTRGDINTDFFMSPREIEFSKTHKKHFFLYRVYGLTEENDGTFYVVKGDVTEEFDPQPTGFKLSKK